MGKLKRTALIGGVLAVMAGVASWFGPFITGDAVEGVLERVRRSVGARRRGQPNR